MAASRRLGGSAGEAGVAAVGLGEQRDHGAAFAERAGVQDDGGGLPFHIGYRVALPHTRLGEVG